MPALVSQKIRFVFGTSQREVHTGAMGEQEMECPVVFCLSLALECSWSSSQQSFAAFCFHFPSLWALMSPCDFENKCLEVACAKS